MGVMSHHGQNFKESEISHFTSNSSDIKITLTSKSISLLHLTKSSHVAAKAQNGLPYGHVVKPTTQNGFFGTCSLPLFDAIFFFFWLSILHGCAKLFLIWQKLKIQDHLTFSSFSHGSGIPRPAKIAAFEFLQRSSHKWKLGTFVSGVLPPLSWSLYIDRCNLQFLPHFFANSSIALALMF